ncbi:rhomboid family intramembrane serine protease [Pseudonocardia nantongensis]|uniref:rhomboid family intramembrane serine protease n=1 Tax=Pseudonocardia nantongensis TaxID=1181885 RepID=UPI00397B8540
MDCVGAAARVAPRWRNVAGASRTGRPVIVPGLVVINVAIFVLTVVQAGSLNRNFASGLFDVGALVPVLVADGEVWRLVTAGFLHIGPLHLAFNMIALWIIGREVESVLGRARFLAVYGAALLGGSAAVMLFGAAGTPVAGASGAVFGLMGALVVLLRRLRIPAGQAFTIIAVNVAISVVVPGISLTAHLGGLVVGALVTMVLVHLGVSSPHRRRIQIAAVGGIVLLTLLLSTGALLLL